MVTGQARWKEIMGMPVTRLEAQAMEDRVYTHILSAATAIEALDIILTKKGILDDNELLTAVAELVKQKTEQANAAANSSNIVEV